MSNFVSGMWIGCCIAIIGLSLLIDPKERFKEFSITNNIAHYSQKTGKYIQDSLVIENDSTIKIIRLDK